MYACGRQKAATDSSTDRFLSIDGKVGCLLNVFMYHTIDHYSSHTNMSVALSMVLNYGPVTAITPTWRSVVLHLFKLFFVFVCFLWFFTFLCSNSETVSFTNLQPVYYMMHICFLFSDFINYKCIQSNGLSTLICATCKLVLKVLNLSIRTALSVLYSFSLPDRFCCHNTKNNNVTTSQGSSSSPYTAMYSQFRGESWALRADLNDAASHDPPFFSPCHCHSVSFVQIIFWGPTAGDRFTPDSHFGSDGCWERTAQVKNLKPC